MIWELLREPAAGHWALALVHFVWQGAAIAAVVAVLLRLPALDTPRRRYLLSLLALAAMLACPVLTFMILSADGSVAMGPSFELDHRQLAVGPRAATTTSNSSEAGPLPAVEIEHLLTRLQPYLLFAWLAGVVFLGVRLCGCYLGTRWLRAERLPLPAELASRVGPLLKRLSMPCTAAESGPIVCSSSRVREAVAMGLWQPVVLVPLAWVTELPADVLEAVIAHELAHIRRHDLWATLFQRLVETLLFYHPAVWWLSRRTSLERELCCDEMAAAATGRRVAYAQALETLGRMQSKPPVLALATSFHGENKMNLLKRVRHVLGQHDQRTSGIAWPAGVLIVGLIASLAWLASGPGTVAQAQDEKKPAAREGEKEGAKQKSAEGEAGEKKSAEAAAKKKSAEAEAGAKKSAEAAAQKKSAEAEAAKRKSAEGEAKARFAEEEAYKRKIGELQAAKKGAEEAYKRKFAEAEAAKKKFAEAAEQRKSPEAEAKRKSAEAEAVYRKAAEGEARKEGDTFKPRFENKPLEGFKPQTAREAVLLEMIQALQSELAQLRREVSQMRGEKGDFRPRDGEGAKAGPRDGDAPVKKGPRDGDAPKTGPRDGERGDKPVARDGEKSDKPVARDGEKPEKPVARDGDAPPKKGPRDGEGEKPGPRDGEGPAKKGPRDGEGPAKTGPRDDEGAAKKEG